jgi:hypothetical protein
MCFSPNRRLLEFASTRRDGSFLTPMRSLLSLEELKPGWLSALYALAQTARVGQEKRVVFPELPEMAACACENRSEIRDTARHPLPLQLWPSDHMNTPRTQSQISDRDLSF